MCMPAECSVRWDCALYTFEERVIHFVPPGDVQEGSFARCLVSARKDGMAALKENRALLVGMCPYVLEAQQTGPSIECDIVQNVCEIFCKGCMCYCHAYSPFAKHPCPTLSNSNRRTTLQFTDFSKPCCRAAITGCPRNMLKFPLVVKNQSRDLGP